jgi:hypothetical protein
MAVNKPVGDNARKGSVKKRTQLKARLGGVTAWTKRSKTSGEFMAVKKSPARKSRQEVQGRAAGEDVKGSDFLEVVITAAAMAASVNPLSVRSPWLARSRSLAAMRFRASLVQLRTAV